MIENLQNLSGDAIVSYMKDELADTYTEEEIEEFFLRMERVGRPGGWTSALYDFPLGEDFDFINDRLVTGAGIYHPDDVRSLLKWGITDILDCRAEDNVSEEMAAEFPDVNYLWNGCYDDGRDDDKGTAYWQRSVEFGLEVLACPGRILYVHCAAGINRGPSNAYAILRATGVTAPQAFNLIRKARPIVGLVYMEQADKALRELGYYPTARMDRNRQRGR